MVNLSFKDFILSENDMYDNSENEFDAYSSWKNNEPVKYARHLQSFFGAPDEVTNSRAIWYSVDGFKRIEILDEYIMHASPAPHYDYVYCFIDLKVPHSMSNILADSSESILLDHLKGEVGARCASLSANAVTLQYVMDVVEGKVKPSKQEYELRIKSMKKMFEDGKRFKLDWWPDNTKDTDPANPYYEHVDHHHCNLLEKSAGLWANIHAKRKRIQAGSGEKMNSLNNKNAPTKKEIKLASESFLSVPLGTTGKRIKWKPVLQGIRMADGTIKKLPPGKSGSSGSGGAADGGSGE